MKLNPNVHVDTGYNRYVDLYYPDEGYALWRDNDESNLDPEGQPLQYSFRLQIQKNASGEAAPHIRARQIDETMQICSRRYQPEGLPFTEEAGTYLDAAGQEQEKRGVY